ncbi:protein immune deficiency [Cloeon dipterum]|uniref:protein immune deficiency n=1 Tax=Cloeon dipterum TaxID=197152 RepID=UPI003220882F
MTDDFNRDIVTDAGPTPETLSTLVGARTNQPNNFLENQSENTPGNSSVITSFVNNAESSYVNIQHASNFQMGNNFSFNFVKPGKKKQKIKSLQKIENSRLPAILQRPDLRVTTGKIKDIRIGEPWRFVMRHLGLSNPEIENKYEEFIIKGGIEEVIYQLLRTWVEKNGSDATLDKLSRALYMENQHDALERLGQVYFLNESH